MKRIVYSPYSGAAAGTTQPELTQAEIDALQTQINDILDDGILSGHEKATYFVPKITELNQLTDQLEISAANYSLSTTNIAAAQTALNNYLTGLTPAWDDTAQDTTVNRTTLNGFITDLTNEISLLQKEVAIASDGLNSATVLLYQRSASLPSVPSNTVTYTFADGSMSPAPNNGWSTTIPASDGNPLYITRAIASASGASATDDILTGDWDAPVIWTQDGADGADGSSGNSVFFAQQFQRSASQPAVPTGGSYNFGTQTLTPSTGWSATPPATDGNPLWVSTTIAEAAPGGTDSTLTWGNPATLTTDGADGSDGAAGSDGNSVFYAQQFQRSASQPATPTGGSYNFGTQTLTPSSGWSTTPPASDGNPLWVTTAIAEAATGGTDSTLSWATPSNLVSDGADGNDGNDGIAASFFNGFETTGLSVFNSWNKDAGEGGTLTAETTTVFSGSQAGLMGSTVTSPTSSGAGGSFYVVVPQELALSFVGQTITVSVYARQPGTNASSQFAVGYSTNDNGNSGWFNFTPTTSWQKFSFDYLVPDPISGGTDYIMIHPDTSGSGLEIIVDNVSAVIKGDTGAAGADGADGQSSRYPTIYRLNSNAINSTSGTFADPLSGNTSWSYSVPSMTADGDTIYSATRIFTSDGAAPQQSSWSTPAVYATRQDGVDGSTGQSTRTVNLYKLNDSTLTSSTGGTFADPIAGNTDWSYNVPAITADGDQVYVATRTFTSDGLSPQDASWTTPAVYSARVDGNDGAPGAPGADGADGADGVVGALNLGWKTDDLQHWYTAPNGSNSYDTTTGGFDNVQLATNQTDTPIGSVAIQCTDNDTGIHAILSEPIPIDPNKTYKISGWFKQTTGDRLNYPTVAQLDETKTNIVNPTANDGATGWPSSGTYSYFGAAGQVLPSTYTKYEITVGPNGTATWGNSARWFCIGGYLTSAGTTNTNVFMNGVRVEELTDFTEIPNVEVDPAIHFDPIAESSSPFQKTSANTALESFLWENGLYKIGVDGWGTPIVSGAKIASGAMMRGTIAAIGNSHRVMVGLTDVDDPTSYTQFDYAIYQQSGVAGYQIYENGVNQQTLSTIPAVGDVVEVVYYGSNVYYYINGVLERTSNTTSGRSFRGAADIYDQYARVTGLWFGQATVPGADVTSANTAAAITNQGALAVQDDVDYDSQVTNLPDGAGYLNEGWDMANPKKWVTGTLGTGVPVDESASWLNGVSVISGTGASPVGDSYMRFDDTGGDEQFWNKDTIPVSPDKTYKMGVWARQPQGNGLNYISIAAADGLGVNIQANGDANGLLWNNDPVPGLDTGSGTYLYWGVVNGAFPTSFTYYEITFGANTALPLPAGTRQINIGMLITRGDSVRTQVDIGFMGIQEVLGLDNPLLSNDALATQVPSMLFNPQLRILDTEGKPAGIQPVEGTSTRDQLVPLSTDGGFKIIVGGDPTVAYGFPAIPVDEKITYEVTVRHRSTGASSNGLYIRMNELNVALPIGKTHIGNSGGSMTQNRTSFRSLDQENGPMPGTTWVEETFTYTPSPGHRFASLSFYNWVATSVGYEVAWVQMQPIGNYDIGADVTANNTAQAIASQGAFATQSTFTAAQFADANLATGSNIIADPHFQDELYWVTVPQTTMNIDYSTDATALTQLGCKKCVRFQGTNTSSGGVTYPRVEVRDPIPVAVNIRRFNVKFQIYVATIETGTNTAGMVFQLRTRNKDGTFGYPALSIPASTFTTTGLKTLYGNITVNADTVDIEPNYQHSVLAGTTTNAVFYVGPAQLTPVIELGDGGLVREDGVTHVTDDTAITSLGTAQGIDNQAATATSSDFSVITGATKPANNATVGATWGTDVANRPANLAGLAGTEAVDNDLLTFDPRLTSNLLRIDKWTLGKSTWSASLDDWSVYGGSPTASNTIITTTGPNGYPVLAWEADCLINQDPSGSWSGGFYAYVRQGNFNRDKPYRFTCFVKRPVNNTRPHYFGWGANDVSSLGAGDNPSSNPYVLANINPPNTTDWVLFVGVIWPRGYTGGDTGLAGMYRLSDGERISDGTEWKWAATEGDFYVRIAQYRSQVGDQTLYFAPRFDELNGSEPSIAGIIKSATIPPEWDDILNGSGLKPEDLADVTKYLTGNSELVLEYDSDGVIKSNEVPVTKLYKLFTSSGVQITSGITWSVTTTTGSWSGTAPSITGSGTGSLTVNSGPSSATAVIEVKAVSNGKEYKMNLNVSKQQDPPPIQATTQVSQSISDNCNTSWSQQGEELVFETQANGDASLSTGNLSVTAQAYGNSGNGTCNVQGRWSYWTGSAWSVIGAVQDSNPDPTVIDEGGGLVLPDVIGTLNCARTITTLSANTEYRFKFECRISSQTGVNTITSTQQLGTLSGSGT